MKRLMGYTAVILATLGILVILWEFRLIVLLFVLSLFVAAAVRPLMNPLMVVGLPRWTAQLLVYVLGIGGFLLVVTVLGNLLLVEINGMVNKVVVSYNDLYQQWLDAGNWHQTIIEVLPLPLSLSTPDEAEIEAILPTVFDLAQILGWFVASLVVVLALSLYWSTDQYHFERLWLSSLSSAWRTNARNIWRELETATGAYLRTQLLKSLLVAILLGLGAYALGLDFPLTLALLAAFAAFVPLFGGLGMAVVAYLVGSLDGTAVAAIAALYTLLIFVSLEYLIGRHLLPRRRQSYLLTILTIIPMVKAFGLLGLVGAPLLAVSLEVVILYYFQAQVARRNTAVQLTELERRYQELKNQVPQSANGNSLELGNLLERLHHLLQQAKEAGV